MDDGVLSAAIHPNLHSPEDIFQNYRGRRAGIIKALTEDVEKFYEQCDPEKENLCLYGLPNETWEVNLPSQEVPAELPEPASGINFARDGMAKKDWLSLVAEYSDAWLLSLAFYYGGRFGFDKEARRRLFMMISGLSTVFEAVNGGDKKQVKTPNGSSNNKSGSMSPKQPKSNSKPLKQSPPKLEKDNGAREDGGGEDQALTMCIACGEIYANGEFWICCDLCDRWFHGKCVRMSPGRAEHIKQYMCPGCSYKRVKKFFS